MPDHPSDPTPAAPARRRLVRAPRDLAAGLGLATLAGVALSAGAHLDPGRLRAMGPGMLPRAIAVLTLLSGIALVVSAFLKGGPPLGRWRLRAPVLVSLAVVGFALTIRTAGLAVAGPLVVLVGGAATEEVRFRELAVLAVVLTGLCIGLFRYALGLPIPVFVLPELLGR